MVGVVFVATQCTSEIGFAADKEAKQAESQGPPRVFLLDGKHLQGVCRRIRDGDKSLGPAWEGLERDAQRVLKAGPFSVVHKSAAPPSGDKHDYMSQAPYFWPNPETTNGLPYVRRDGERNPEINRFPDHRVMDEMVDAVETLALAYYLDGNKAYASKAGELLRAWFLDPATRMNPHLQYAQAIPGINTGRGIGLIETRGLTRVGDAIGLLAGSNALTEADERGLREWFDKFLTWMRESQNGRDEAAAKNNHGTYYDVQVASFALFVGKPDLARGVLQMAKEKRIAVQIEPDGRQPLELARTKAWSYSIGNLQGLLLLARLGENVGVDLWNFETADGRSIRKAFDYLAPFGAGEEKWPHRQLGGFSPRALGPVVRRLAGKFPDDRYRTLLVKFPDEDPASRAHLLRPGVAERQSLTAQDSEQKPRASALQFRFEAVSDKSLGLWEGDRPVLVYNHGIMSKPGVPAAHNRSTYIHPIYGLDGEVLTDDFPADHLDHRGLYWAWPHIKIGSREFDLWSMRGIRYEFQRWLAQEPTNTGAVLGVENGWFVGDKKVMREEVRIKVHPATSESRSIDVELTWTPTDQSITLWGSEGKSYGGLTLRFGPRSRTMITVPTGRTSEDLVVTKLPWADFSGDLNRSAAGLSGVAVFVHPEHPDFPPTWMTRHYGMLAVGWPGVAPQTFAAGKPFACRYRLWIHRGAPEVAEIQKAYETYRAVGK